MTQVIKKIFTNRYYRASRMNVNFFARQLTVITDYSVSNHNLLIDGADEKSKYNRQVSSNYVGQCGVTSLYFLVFLEYPKNHSTLRNSFLLRTDYRVGSWLFAPADAREVAENSTYPSYTCRIRRVSTRLGRADLGYQNTFFFP